MTTGLLPCTLEIMVRTWVNNGLAFCKQFPVMIKYHILMHKVKGRQYPRLIYLKHNLIFFKIKGNPL